MAPKIYCWPNWQVRTVSTGFTWKCFVFPGVAETGTFFVCMRALMVELLPTLGYPTWKTQTRPQRLQSGPKFNGLGSVHVKTKSVPVTGTLLVFTCIFMCQNQVRQISQQLSAIFRTWQPIQTDCIRDGNVRYIRVEWIRVTEVLAIAYTHNGLSAWILTAILLVAEAA